MTLRQFVPILLLVFVAAFSSWLVVNSLKTPLTTSNSPTNPDSFAVDTLSIRMRALDGLPQDQLYAAALVHYPQGNTTDITAPHLILFNTDKKAPWHVYAKKGQTQNGIAILELSGNVKLVQAAGPHNADLTATTSQITLFPQKQLAKTQRPIHIQQKNVHLEADSATLDHKTGISVFTHHVKLTQENTILTADNMVAHSNAHGQLETVWATGQPAKATQGRDSVAGPRLDYDVSRQIITSPTSPQGRTSIIIQPDQKLR